MAILNRDVTTEGAQKWNLAYDQGRREFCVDIKLNGAVKRHGVDAAMKMDGADEGAQDPFYAFHHRTGLNRYVPSSK